MTNVSTESLAAASGSFRFGGDLSVYRLGFGAMRITGKGIWGAPKDHDETIRVLKRSIEMGVNLIDTADAYGPNVSEELIAEALYPYPAGLVIATKGGLTRSGPDQWAPDGRPEHLREALEASLQRLRLDCIDVYQFHRPDPKVPFEESVGTLADLRRQGKIRHVGLSNVSVEQIQTAQSIVPIVSVQNLYNLSDRSSESVLDFCESNGIGFIPWAPLESGQGTSRGGAVKHVAEAHSTRPGTVALAWLLRRSPVMLPIPGTSSVAHLEENMQAATLQLSDDEFSEIDRA
jgi:aryl-alcohol dehydrogenase-like predicted oxidoreductase